MFSLFAGINKEILSSNISVSFPPEAIVKT
jgi:hypothetical protein